MSYEFRLLGPIELRHHGATIRMRQPKRQAMLAALTLAANRPVPLTLLTEAVWVEAPPGSAVANLRSHATALRRELGERLLTHPGGYELRVEEGESDVAQFHRRTAAGQRLLAAGDPDGARIELAAALTLWRGPAGEGLVRGALLDARLAGLDEQRLGVFEDYVRAATGAVSPALLTNQLRDHLARHPLRERAWGQLMLVRYRSGDVAGALAAYGEAGQVLRAELGVEPGPDLAALHRAMLKRDPALGEIAGPPILLTGRPGTPDPALRQLPPDPAVLVGRDRELATVTDALRRASGGAGPSIVVVTGRGGTGKTALAARAAHLVASVFPGGQLTVRLGASTGQQHGSGHIVDQVLRTLDVEGPTDPGLRVELFRSLLAIRRILVLLDDVACPAQLRPLTPADGGALLVTTRRPLATLDPVARVELDPLDPADGAELLRRHLGATRVDAELACAADLVNRCAGLPLALRIVAARLALRPGCPLALLVEHLRESPLDGLTLEDLSVRDSIAADHRAVIEENPLAARCFALLARWQDQPTSIHRAAQELGESQGQVFHALEHLVDAGLAESPQPSRYRLPALVDEYAAELLNQTPLDLTTGS